MNISKIQMNKIAKMILEKINEIYYFNSEHNTKGLHIGNGIFEEVYPEDIEFHKTNNNGDYSVILPVHSLGMIGNISYKPKQEYFESYDLSDAFVDIEAIGEVKIPQEQRQLILSTKDKCVLCFGVRPSGDFTEIYDESSNDINYGVVDADSGDVTEFTDKELFEDVVDFDYPITNEVYYIPKFKINLPEDLLSVNEM